MKTFYRFAALVSSCSLFAAAPVSVQAQARPTASEIVAKYVTAIGGETEIRKITSLQQSATMEVPAVGLSASMEVFAAAPNKMATKASIPGMGEMLTGYNGTVAWDVNPMAGPRLLADKELTTMAENADFYANLLYSADRFVSMETVGDTTISGEKAYAVKMVRKGSLKESMTYFSASSGLLLGGSSKSVSQMGEMQINQTVKDYKKFGNLLMPTLIEQVMGPQSILMTINSVSFNSVPDSMFAVPAQVRPLIKP